MLFSILIPAYKSRYLKEAIDSCFSQTYKYFEIIIVDDASPENLKSIIDDYSDERLYYYRNQNNCGAINVVDNWNICLSYAKGDYVICMGDDDRLLPNCLEEYAMLIEKYPGIGLLHGWTEIIDEDSNVVSLTTHRCEYESAMSLAWHRSHAYELQFIGDFCFNTEWLRSQGGFYKLPLAWGSDDISAIIGAMKNGVANTQVPVFQYRRNRYTISSTGNTMIKVDAIIAENKWYKEFLEFYKGDKNDCIYASEMKDSLNRRFQKKLGLTIAYQLRNNRLKILYWIKNKTKYHLNKQTLIYAFIQSFKK